DPPPQGPDVPTRCWDTPTDPGLSTMPEVPPVLQQEVSTMASTAGKVLRGEPTGTICTAALYFDAEGDAQELVIEGPQCPEELRQRACSLLLDAEAAPRPGASARRLRLQLKK
ncbi:MAG: hypothetical protein RL071_3317, partial [Pseudomonadota bacterium]